MKNMKKIITLLVVLIAVGLVVTAIIRKKSQLSKATNLSKMPIPVKTVKGRIGEYLLQTDYVATVYPQTYSTINSRITAEILKVNFREGKIAKKGEVLIQLDDRSYKQNITISQSNINNINAEIEKNKVLIATIESTLKYWKKELQRQQDLHEHKATTAQKLDSTLQKYNEVFGELQIAIQSDRTLLAQLQKAKADLELAKTNLSYTQIKAPYDCRIIDVPVDPGVMASQNKPIITIEEEAKLKLTLMIPQKDFAKTKVLQGISIPNISATIPISKVYPALDENKMLRIDANIPNEIVSKFRTGEYRNVKLTNSIIKSAMILPISAVKKIDKRYSIFTIDEKNILKEIEVKVCATDENTIAIIPPIQQETPVVISSYLGWAKLSSGLFVKDVSKVLK
jgi:RND family efflux transporter MFP subunit